MAYKHDYDKTLLRLNVILSRLNDGEGLSVKALAEEFNVSDRTIQRDFNERLVALYPIYKDKRLWRMQRGFKLEKLNSREDELVLNILDKLVEGMGTTFSSKAKNLLSKIHNTQENPIYAKQNMEDISTHLEEIALLRVCIEEQVVVRCIYTKDRDVARDRVIKPLKIVTYEGFWYLVALNERDKIRKYYLKNISNIQKSEITFKSDVAINETLEKSISIWFHSEGEAFKVTLLADVQVAKYFKRKPLPTQVIQSQESDGSIVFSIEVTHEAEVMSLVKCRLPYLRVIEPLWIKEKIDEELKTFLLV